MVSKLQNAIDKKLVNTPKWLRDNLHYEVIMGSNAYGVSTDSSDLDMYGWAIPPKDMMFPHLTGYIEGFGTKPQRFEQYQEHHIQNGDTEYDFSIYSIIKYAQLCLENNPNMIDSLFVPTNCVTYCTPLGQILRDNRKLFLHKGSYSKFRGYAYAQLHKMKSHSSNSKNPKRRESIETHGFDVKFAYHIVRLLNEVDQILSTHDLDLQRDNEILKVIRRGEWTEDQIVEWAEKKIDTLEMIYANSTLRETPPEGTVRALLMSIIEEHYGTISSAIASENGNQLLNELKLLIGKYETN